MKRLQTLFKMTVFAGIIIILGTAGASDLERLGIEDAIWQIVLGGILTVSGSLGLRAAKAKKIRRCNQRCKKIKLNNRRELTSAA